MIRIKDPKQLQMFDPWGFLSPKRRRILDETWPGLFREHLLCELPVNKVTPFFREGFVRPTKELYTVLGVLLFQQMLDLSDAEAINHLMFNIQWHYALNLYEESDEAKYIGDKTLWSMRQLIIRKNLDAVMFESISDKLSSVFKVNTDFQRIDSVHIRSNMRKLGRIGIFVRTIHRFLKNLKRHHPRLFKTIKDDVIERYLPEKALAAFSMVKPTESEKTLQTVSADLFDLIEAFKDRPKVCSRHSYKLMKRVLNDQCIVESDGKEERVGVKKPARIPSDSLQNPSDPDAAYSGHKGQGYQVQVMETFSKTDDPDEKKKTLNLITHVDVQPACEHDGKALVPAIADTKIRGVGPKEVLADTLYGSDENHQAAKAAKVDLIAPTLKGGSTKDPMAGFEFDDKGYVTSCPQEHNPEKVKYKKKRQRYTAYFKPDQCKACPNAKECPAQPGKKYYSVHYSARQHRLALRRRTEETNEFTDSYRWRAGVEATMSAYDRRTGVKNLRVRGLEAVRFCAILKAAGLNLIRAAAVRRARRKAKQADNSLAGTFLKLFAVVKERIYKIVSRSGPFFQEVTRTADDYLKIAA